MIKLSVALELSLVLKLLVQTVAYNSKVARNDAGTKCNDRRGFLKTLGISVPASFFAYADGSSAFENRLDSQYLDRTPQVGTQPDNLGVGIRTSKLLGKDYMGLAPCDGRPNCWCSSTPFQDSPARYIDPWGSEQKSIRDVKEVIDTYKVGQQGIDGGGFKVMNYDEDGQYLYVQFQSYKNGYIDDTEFWYNPEKKQFDVRSASRLGQSDLGVNAKRLEYIGSRLEKEFGWNLKRRKNGSLV